MLVHPNPILYRMHITIVTFIIKLEYIGAPKPSVLHQHICCICNFNNRIEYVGAPKPRLHYIHVKFASDLYSI
jgi:hypothetical protein